MFFLIFPFLKLLLFHDQVDSFTIGVVGCTRVGQLLSSERHKNEKYSITIRCRDSLLRSISKKDSAVSIPEEQPKDFVLNAGEEKKILDTVAKGKNDDDLLKSLDPSVYSQHFIDRLYELKGFKDTNGHCLVPRNYAINPSLGNWVSKCRMFYRKFQDGEQCSMNEYRIAVLDQMGFVWNTKLVRNEIYSKKWMGYFQELKDYKAEHGNLKVLQTTSLGSWIQRQRKSYMKWEQGNKTVMTKEKIELLESIGFDWTPWDTKWTTRIKELKVYRKKFGNCLVPVNFKENAQLGQWVISQRQHYKLQLNGDGDGRLTDKRIKELNSIGFVWDYWEIKGVNWSTF